MKNLINNFQKQLDQKNEELNKIKEELNIFKQKKKEDLNKNISDPKNYRIIYQKLEKECQEINKKYKEEKTINEQFVNSLKRILIV